MTTVVKNNKNHMDLNIPSEIIFGFKDDKVRINNIYERLKRLEHYIGSRRIIEMIIKFDTTPISDSYPKTFKPENVIDKIP